MQHATTRSQSPATVDLLEKGLSSVQPQAPLAPLAPQMGPSLTDEIADWPMSQGCQGRRKAAGAALASETAAGVQWWKPVAETHWREHCENPVTTACYSFAAGSKYNRRVYITHTKGHSYSIHIRRSRFLNCGDGSLLWVEPLETNPQSFFFLKGIKHRFCVCDRPPWDQGKGGWCRLEAWEESWEREILGRVLREWLCDFQGPVIPGLRSSHLS